MVGGFWNLSCDVYFGSALSSGMTRRSLFFFMKMTSVYWRGGLMQSETGNQEAQVKDWYLDSGNGIDYLEV